MIEQISNIRILYAEELHSIKISSVCIILLLVFMHNKCCVKFVIISVI